jgi:ethanolamine ammonia-lyase small subunit
MPPDPAPARAAAVATPAEADAWAALRPSTPARIGLARAGDALALTHVLELQLGHAKARDAVHVPLDVERTRDALGPPAASLHVRSRAPDRVTYLRRPDLGRVLDEACVGDLPAGPFDVVFVLADGLSSFAVERNGAAMLAACLARLEGWTIAPVVVATQARVALADDIGERMGAAMSVILIGERPGLSVADSLGAYLTYAPRRGRRDSERNCISNIHGAGLSTERAADTLVWLMTEARARGLTGVGLKDETPDPQPLLR